MKPVSIERSVRRPATISAVAVRAGVSESTVSRVLKGGALVREVTRQRVQEALAELGYRPSFLPLDRGGRRLATISDVAARAGVGEATVSRVLNGSALVRTSTRQRVQGEGAEMAAWQAAIPNDASGRREKGAHRPGSNRIAEGTIGTTWPPPTGNPMP